MVAIVLGCVISYVASPAFANAEGYGGVADTSQADTEAAAASVAEQYDHPVSVTNDTTESSTVEAQPDGTFELTESSQPVRVQRGGVWVPVDLDLTSQAGMFAPAATVQPVQFSSGGRGPMARVRSAGGTWLSEYWSAGDLPAPTVSDAQATYANVLPGVDLQLTATTSGMASVLVVHSAQAAANPALNAVHLGIAGASVAPVPGTGEGADSNAIAASDGIAAASPTWWDSSAGDDAAAGETNAARPLDTEVSATDLILHVADAAQTPGVVYPVYVDPDWTGGVQAHAFVDSAYPSQSYWNGADASDKYQHVGYIQSAWSDDGKSHKTRSYWRMSLAGVANKDIIKATFDTNEVYASSCNKTEVDLYTTSGISSGTTWNSQPGSAVKQSSATVAYGYSSSCPAHSVGFTATSGVRSAVNADESSLTLMLRADDESDTLTWKKFEASASLVIDYDSYPSAVSGLAVSGCSFVCSPTAYTRDNTPALSAKASDPDGGTLTLNFSVYSSSGARIQIGTRGGVASGAATSWTLSSAVADGTYTYDVYASDGTVNGPTSGRFKFVVDTHAPSAPALKASGGLSTDPDTPAGAVGSTVETVAITPSAADNAYGYVYAIAPTGATVTFPANVACNTETAGYTIVCASSIGAAKDVTVTAPDDHSTFAAATFDAAGNTRGTSSSITFNAVADETSFSAGHSWATDTANTPCPGGQAGPVTDTATTNAQDLALTGSACWGYDATAPSPDGGLGTGTLSFDGKSGAQTSAATLNTAKSYTVAAWVNPANPASGYFDAMGQDGVHDSAYYLQQSNTAWSFCVSSADPATSWQGTCANSPAGSVVANQWIFVVGEYNATNHTATLRLGNSSGIGLQTPIIASATGASYTGPMQVGRALIYSAYRPWTGAVLDPVAVPGIADTAQLQHLMQLSAPNRAGGSD